MKTNLEKFLGPESKFFQKLDPLRETGIVFQLKKDLNKILEEKIINQFDLNTDESAMRKLLNEIKSGNTKNVNDLKDIFSLSEESPMKTFTENLNKKIKELGDEYNKKVSELIAVISKNEEKKNIEDKTTLQGKRFEDNLFNFVEKKFSHDCLVTQTGNMQGKRGKKVGDIVIELRKNSKGSGKRIVIEAKSDKSYNLPKAIKELEEAKKVRKADVGIFVFQKGKAPDALDGFTREGRDVYLTWDDESSSRDGYLEGAIELVKGLFVLEDIKIDNKKFDYKKLKDATESLTNKLKDLEEIETKSSTIKKSVNAIIFVSENLQNDLKDEIKKLKELLN